MEITKEKILKAIVWAEEQGWAIEEGVFVDLVSKSCCPLTALAMFNGLDYQEPPEPWKGKGWPVIHKLGLNENPDFKDGFIDGFDGRGRDFPVSDDYWEGRLLGEKIRLELKNRGNVL